MNRSAPKVGYSTPEKQNYRRIVYSGFKKIFGPAIRNKQLVLLPSAEGEEIDTALQFGFQLENLHVVDKNPAIVASLNRRYKNQLHTYGRPIEDALYVMASNGVRVDAVNLDLCFPIGNKQRDTLRDCMQLLMYPCAVSITLQRGREVGTVADIITETATNPKTIANHPDLPRIFSGRYYGKIPFTPQDLLRLNTCLGQGEDPVKAVRFTDAFLSRWGIYRGGKVSMLWALLWINP